MDTISGGIDNPIVEVGKFTLTGMLAALSQFITPLNWHHKAMVKFKYSSKSGCKLITTPYKGINPLNRDKWILQARGAF